jgi:N-methylhydantoinase B
VRRPQDDLAEVLIPPTPGVMSAFGFLSSDIQNEFPETYLRVAEETRAQELKATIEGLIAQADEVPLIADRRGRMVVGQFGSPVDTVLENSPYTVEDLKDGDVIALNDPYMMEGSTSHLPDILLVRPIFYEEDHIGYALQWGNLMDVGGSTAGTIPIDARSIYEEGVRLPPVKLYDGGTLNEDVLRFFCHNSRTPRESRADVMAIAAGTAAGA